MAFDDLKKRVLEEIDRNADHLIDNVGDPVYRDPELGFKEFKTAKIVGQGSAGSASPTTRRSRSPA
ncbi:MAG: hypothetical protein R2849_17365 [Thermomicrobiales bacterium]